MAYVFYGKDDFSAHEALEELERTLDTDGQVADNTVRVDGASAKPAELLAQCQTVPFLGSTRLIIVRGLLGRFESSGGGRRRRPARDGDLGAWEAFVAGLDALPDTTELVFIDGDVSPTNAFLRALVPHKPKVREFKPLPQGELAAWILERAERYGVAIEARATAAMAGLVGNHLWTLDSELRKLATYAGDRAVSEDDVRALVSLAREPSVFATADAIVEGRERDAVELYERLLADGEPPQRLLAMIARQYRLLLLTKELQQRSVSPAEMSGRLQVQGFVMQRLLRQAPAYDIERLRQAYRRLLEADLSIKRGIYDDETALHLLITELAAMARARQEAAAPSQKLRA